MANLLEFIEGGESSGSQAATEELNKYGKKKSQNVFELVTEQKLC